MRSTAQAPGRGPLTELRGVDGQDDLRGDRGQGALCLRLLQADLAGPELEVERRGRAEEPTQQQVLGRSDRQRADQAAGAAVEPAPGEQRRHPGVLAEGLETLRAVGDHGQVSHRLQAGSQPLHGARGVEADGSALADEIDELVGDPVLRRRLPAVAGGERLGPRGQRPAPHPSHRTGVSQRVEVAPDRHLAHRQLAGQVGRAHSAVGVHPLPDGVQAGDGVDAHGAPASVRNRSRRQATSRRSIRPPGPAGHLEMFGTSRTHSTAQAAAPRQAGRASIRASISSSVL